MFAESAMTKYKNAVDMNELLHLLLDELFIDFL